MSTYAGPEIATDNLVLYYDAANTKSYPGSGTAVYNLIQPTNIQTGTLIATFSTTNKGTWTTRIDAIGDFLTFYTTPASNFTIQLWFKRTSTAYDVHMWSSRLAADSGFRAYFTSATTLVVQPSQGTILTTSDLTTDNIALYSFTFAPTETADVICSVYQNGELKNSGTISGGGISSKYLVICETWTSFSTLGLRSANEVSTVQVYERVLTADEIYKSFIAQRGRFGI